ncbi:hypothetical protein BD769DRAFT_1390378 [Suillus cothurnatus]|nr:hypothetical protein BD769DRAFT_1390378 [Suillus cothurnatus]
MAAMPYYTHPHHVPSTAESSWIEDMIAHIKVCHISEFLMSGSGENVSVFWGPELLSLTDPFSIHSPTNTILCTPSPLWEVAAPPSSPTGSPDAQTPMWLGATNMSHEFESSLPVLTIDPAHEEERSHMWCRGLQRVVYIHKAMKKKSAVFMQPDEQKEGENMVREAKPVV